SCWYGVSDLRTLPVAKIGPHEWESACGLIRAWSCRSHACRVVPSGRGGRTETVSALESPSDRQRDAMKTRLSDLCLNPCGRWVYGAGGLTGGRRCAAQPAASKTRAA